MTSLIIVGFNMIKNIIIAVLLICNIGFIAYFALPLKLSSSKANAAINLSKQAKTLENNIENQEFILSKMKGISGVLNIEGWNVKKISENVFLVEFKYDRPVTSWEFDSRYIFEVNVMQKIVRNVIGDYELEVQYGLIDTKEKLYKICYKSFKESSRYYYKNGKLDVFENVILYKNFIDIIQYHHQYNLEFEYDKFFGYTRKPFLKELLNSFSDKSEGNNLPMLYEKDFGTNIYEFHNALMNVLNKALVNAKE